MVCPYRTPIKRYLLHNKLDKLTGSCNVRYPYRGVFCREITPLYDIHFHFFNNLDFAGRKVERKNDLVIDMEMKLRRVNIST